MTSSPKRIPDLISIVTTAWNEEENIEAFITQVIEAVEPLGFGYEVVIVDNGSIDETLEIVKKTAEKTPHVRWLSLSRNFGHQGGLVAAMEAAKGDVVVTMDSDLQHPPSKIPELISVWQDGIDIVNTHKLATRRTSKLRAIFDWAFYFVISKLCDMPLYESQSDFRLIDRAPLKVLLSLPEREKFLRGLVHWIGFSNSTISYEQKPRMHGETKFDIKQLVMFSLNGITSFSIMPIRACSILGCLIALGALLYGLFLIGLALFGPEKSYPDGWLTLAVSIFFLSGIILFGIGILGEYIGRISDEVRKRPAYILRSQSDVKE